MTYLKPEIHEKLKAWAESEDRSMSYLIARIVAEAVETKEGKKP